MGSCVWVEAPIMHKMSGLSLAWHWHGAWFLGACALKEPIWDCLFLWLVVKMAYISQGEEPSVFMGL